MSKDKLAILAVIITTLGFVLFDQLYLSKLKKEFMQLETKLIVTSNKLATAKIVSENLNHVRELVFKNMDFPGQKDSVSHETYLFNFITECVNDLKLKLVSLTPSLPQVKGRVTTYSYTILLEGDFFKFGELCAKLENSRRIVSLETFDISLTSLEETSYGGPENKEIKIKMTINTYRIKKSDEQITAEQENKKPGKKRA